MWFCAPEAPVQSTATSLSAKLRDRLRMEWNGIIVVVVVVVVVVAVVVVKRASRGLKGGL